MTGVLPQLRLKPLAGERTYGVVTPAELVGSPRAELGVTRQWISGTGSVVLEPGQRFPDEVVTVISTILRFDNAVDAQAWTRQSVARALMPVHLPVDGPIPSDLVVVRTPGDLGELQYLAFFTNGHTAFALQMVAGGPGGHDKEFVRLVQDWTRQTAVPPTSALSTSESPDRCVAAGDRSITVPAAIGRPLGEAIIAMQQAGLRVVGTGTPEGDPTGSEAIVRAQKPSPGERVPLGACIGFRTAR